MKEIETGLKLESAMFYGSSMLTWIPKKKLITIVGITQNMHHF